MNLKDQKRFIVWITVISIMMILGGVSEAANYYPLQVGNRWVYTPSYGDGTRVDTIVGTEDVNGTLTHVWKREESAPDNYHEKRWMASDDESVKLYKIWGNMALTPAVLINPPVTVGKRNPQLGETSHLEMEIGDIHLKTDSYVESINDVISVPAGTFSNCVVLREMSETTINGVKDYRYEKTWYAPDVGPIVYRRYSSNWETVYFSQELVSFSNAGALHIDINTDQDVYEVGDTLKAFASIYNVEDCQMAEIYIVVGLSDGPFLFYPEFTETVKPVLAEPINICGSPFASDYLLAELLIAGAFPKGNHVWYAVLVRPGTNVMDSKNWLSFDAAPFNVK